MSPHAGESPLPLLFGIASAALGVLIAIYIAWRVVTEWRLRRKVNAERPDPNAYSDYPELQAMVDRFYVLRYRARTRWEADAELSARERDERLHDFDGLIDQGLVAVDDLLGAAEPAEIAEARGRIAQITDALRQRAGQASSEAEAAPE